jgi:uncharacterized protein (TIGR02145 family)
MKQFFFARGVICALLTAVFVSPGAAQTSQPAACGWNPDSNGDFFITITDLLALLSIYEEADSDMDCLFDSMDDCIGIYDACGVCNGGGTDVDVDGVCDDVDLCVGVLDACGVCNGTGPSIPVMVEIILATDSVYLPPVQQWYVFSYAVDTLYTYVCPVQGCTDVNAVNFNALAVIEDGSCSYGPAQCGGASTVTFDGHTYALVGIGSQCWFKENLRSDNYRSGDAIPGDLNDSQWTSTASGAQAVYNNDPANLAMFGRLYNWYAVNDARGLCPAGYHVPTDGEWMTLEMTLGMSFEDANATEYRGTDVGIQLKSSSEDTVPWTGSNSSGFSGVSGGSRSSQDGNFSYLTDIGTLWSSTVGTVGGHSFVRALNSGYDGVYRSIDNHAFGFSVRCLRD